MARNVKYLPFPQAFRKPRYRVSKTGEIEELKGVDTNYYPSTDPGGWRRSALKTAEKFDQDAKDYPFTTVSEAINAAAGSTRKNSFRA